MGLNEDNEDAAYVLGRLFSVLESVQTDANPELNSEIARGNHPGSLF